MDRSYRSPIALLAGGLVLAALTGCGGRETVASQSAAAFSEAQKQGQTFGGDGHAHGHGAATSGDGSGAPEVEPSEGAVEGAPPAHEHAGAGAPAGEHGGHPAGPSEPTPARPDATGQAEHDAGHGAMPQTAPAASTPPPDHAGHEPSPANHAGHGSAMPGQHVAHDLAAPVVVPPGQPAATLLPDALDAPAATSVVDAQRSAEMAQEMAGGGHAGHGAGGYRQLDAGREPGLQPPPPEAPAQPDHQHHHPGPASPPQDQDGKERDREPPRGSGTTPAPERRPA